MLKLDPSVNLRLWTGRMHSTPLRDAHCGIASDLVGAFVFGTMFSLPERQKLVLGNVHSVILVCMFCTTENTSPVLSQCRVLCRSLPKLHLHLSDPVASHY